MLSLPLSLFPFFLLFFCNGWLAQRYLALSPTPISLPVIEYAMHGRDRPKALSPFRECHSSQSTVFCPPLDLGYSGYTFLICLGFYLGGLFYCFEFLFSFPLAALQSSTRAWKRGIRESRRFISAAIPCSKFAITRPSGNPSFVAAGHSIISQPACRCLAGNLW